jgi:hypothetical protein
MTLKYFHVKNGYHNNAEFYAQSQTVGGKREKKLQTKGVWKSDDLSTFMTVKSDFTSA